MSAAELLRKFASALDTLGPAATEGAEELRKLADELDPVVEVEIPDGCVLGDPSPKGPPFNAEGAAYLA